MQDKQPSVNQAAWEALYQALDFDDGNQQARWSEEVERRLKENGLTY